MTIRVVLIDDHKLMREGLKTILARDPDIDVVGEAANGADAIRLASSTSVDVIVMDITMPGIGGIEATRQIVEAGAGAQVVILSMHSDRRFVAEALRAGARGYVLKDAAVDELVSAIRTVATGNPHLSSAVAEVVVRDYVNRITDPSQEASPALTTRERQVLQLLSEGASVKEVAAKLGLSVKTIDSHKRQIMERLHLHSIAELTKYAIREGLTEL